MIRDSAFSTLRLVLHPGHGKCGSSTIQFALYSNVDALRRQGVFVPNRRFEFPTDGPKYRKRLGNPVHYFDLLSEPGDFEAFERRLTECLAAISEAGGHTVIVSAENLGNQPGIKVRRPVHEILARHFADVQVVFYVRRQDEWLVSSWQQWGHKLGWSLEQHVAKGIEDHRPDFLGAALFFEEVYGPGTVEVVPLSSHALIEGNLLADFSERAGVTLLTLPEGQQFRNTSLGSALCDVLSRIHGIYAGKGDRRVRQLFSKLGASQHLAFSSDKTLLSFEIRRQILDHFRMDNERLRERFFPHVPFDGVFGLPDLGGDDATLAGLRARVDGLRDVVAIQMDIILCLLQAAEDKKMSRSLLGRFASRKSPGD